MIIINSDIIEREANASNFVLTVYEKMSRLTTILDEINRHDLCLSLILKGGTAINLGILPLPRASVDIDMNYIGSLNKDTMKKERTEIKKIFYQFMTENGYKFDSCHSKSHYSLDSYIYNYKTTRKSTDSLKIEINYSLRSLILDPVEATTTLTINGKQTKFLMEDPIETYATKIVALLTRGKPRDLFDVDTMLKEKIFNDKQFELLHKCAFFYYTICARNKWHEITFNTIENIDDDAVRKNLIPLLPKHINFDIDEAKKSCKDFLSDFLVISPQEQQFLLCFENKQYAPELLFPENIVERIREHPVALWRCASQEDRERMDERRRSG